MTEQTNHALLREKLAGKFIVIDGPDGAGKSTQQKLLADYLKAAGLEVCLARDPGGTAIGDKIRSILLDNGHAEMSVQCEVMLYMASRAQLAQQVIRPALQKGQCVICDRYISSTIAYQGAGGADTQTIASVADVAVRGLWPDLTVIVDLDEQEGLRRALARRGGPGLDRMESKDLQFHRRVRELFLQQAQHAPATYAAIDGNGSVEQVQQRLRDVIIEFLNRVK